MAVLLGASTISMQTAKNVFLWPGRDWLRKGFEAWFTTLIELAWGKRRILEIYLNVAEWGPGVYGAEAATRHYFHKPADALNQEEAVRLAAALPDPPSGCRASVRSHRAACPSGSSSLRKLSAGCHSRRNRGSASLGHAGSADTGWLTAGSFRSANST